jgi:hypothetical protein
MTNYISTLNMTKIVTCGKQLDPQYAAKTHFQPYEISELPLVTKDAQSTRLLPSRKHYHKKGNYRWFFYRRF